MAIKAGDAVTLLRPRTRTEGYVTQVSEDGEYAIVQWIGRDGAVQATDIYLSSELRKL